MITRASARAEAEMRDELRGFLSRAADSRTAPYTHAGSERPVFERHADETTGGDLPRETSAEDRTSPFFSSALPLAR